MNVLASSIDIMLRNLLTAFLALIGIAIAALPESALGQQQPSPLLNKTIRIVVGYGPGGGYDTLARLIAPELERETGARVVVQNRPGGGGLTVINEAMQTSGRDLELTLVNTAAAVTALMMKSEAVRYDLKSLTWLGGVAADQRVLVVRDEVDPTDWLSESQKPAVIRWAAGGRADNLSLSAVLLSEGMGLNSKIVTGYKGTSEAVAALLRGEADAAVLSLESVEHIARETNLKLAALIARERSKILPTLPNIHELSLRPQAEDWIDFLVAQSSLPRAFAVPPDTAETVVNFLRDSLSKILSSPTFLNTAEKQGRFVEFVSDQQVTTKLENAVRVPQRGGKASDLSAIARKYF